jgi:uncharacterized membrane protein
MDRRGRGCFGMLSAAFLFALAVGVQAAPPQRWTLVDIGTAVGDGSARAINHHGDVAGNANPRVGLSNTSRAFLWQNGLAQDLGAAFAPRPSFVDAISDRGTVYGKVGEDAYIWKDGVGTPLPFAADIHNVNRKETLVGARWQRGAVGLGPLEAFMYRDGVVFDLPGLNGGHYSKGLGINDHDVVVGLSNSAFSADVTAVVWENQQIRALPKLGGQNSVAIRVNNHGLVMGTAEDASANQNLVTWDLRQGGAMTLAMPGHRGFDMNNHGAIIGATWPDGRGFLLDNGVKTMLAELQVMRDAGFISFTPFAINDRGWIVGVGFRPQDGFTGFGRPLLLMPR